MNDIKDSGLSAIATGELDDVTGGGWIGKVAKGAWKGAKKAYDKIPDGVKENVIRSAPYAGVGTGAALAWDKLMD